MSDMNDMSAAITPKSDQWNYDDFIAGPITFKIRDVKVKAGQEQPVEISLEGTDKFYRPCKSMSRCLVSAWGPDSKKYIGRSITLYGDPSIKWGGLCVGGIRISHMSDIDSALTMALTMTRANKKPFTVRPIETPAEAVTEPPSELIATAEECAASGMSIYKAFWANLTPRQKKLIGDERHEANKVIAAAVIEGDKNE